MAQGANHVLTQDDPGPWGPGRRAGDRVPRDGRDDGCGGAGPGAGQGAHRGRRAARRVRRDGDVPQLPPGLQRGADEGRALARVPCGDADVAAGLPGVSRGHEGGDGLRGLPRAGQGARGCRRRQDEDPAARDAVAEGRERDVHDLPLPDAAHVLGRQPARPAQRRLHDLPQHPRGDGREAAQGGERDRAVRAVPSHDRRTSSSSSTTCRCARAS